jgi:hypothetical protein
MSQSGAVDPGSAPSPRAAPFDTTEVRWFADGEMPFSLAQAFSDSADAVNVEVRCDVYRVGGSLDVGVKRRDRELVEIKKRLASAGTVRLGDAVPGRIEEWRKTTPLNGPPAYQDEAEVTSLTARSSDTRSVEAEPDHVARLTQAGGRGSTETWA